MRQKRMKSVWGALTNREAPKTTPKAAMMKKMKKKISNANTTKENQISDSKKFNLSRCQQQKKKRRKSNAEENQISDSQKFKLSICKQQKMKSVQEKIMDIVAYSQGSILEILSWLPVQSLFRFKCVAKSWDITSDPYFRMKHQSLKFLLLHYNFEYKKTNTNFHNLYSTSSLSSPHDVQNINHLSSHNNPCFQLLCGSCDGLVLILVSISSTHELLFLWNPSTRESIQLPFPIFGIRHCSFGLGYDPTTHDYKILTIHSNVSQRQCGILTLKSASWRNLYIETPDIFRTLWNKFHLADPLAFIHGAFHWIPCSFCVASFNISNEVYTKIPLSEQMHSYLSLSASGDYHVSVLDGMLCFSSASKVEGPNNFILWAMKDYGVKESWTQLFKIKVAPYCVAKPIYRFADGDVLFHCRDVASDSLRTSKGRFRLWCDSLVNRRDMVEIITYNESLIDPKLLI